MKTKWIEYCIAIWIVEKYLLRGDTKNKNANITNDRYMQF